MSESDISDISGIMGIITILKLNMMRRCFHELQPRNPEEQVR